MTRATPKGVSKASIKAGFEVADVRPRRVVALLAIVGASLIVSLVLAVFIILQVKPEIVPSGAARSQVFGNAPRLEIDPKADRLALEAKARDRLEGYGPSPDGDRAYARIPIERAMQLLAENGWPDPATTGAAP